MMNAMYVRLQADTYDYIGSSTGLNLQPTATTATVTADTAVACKSCGKAAGPGGMGRGWKVLMPLVLLVLTVLVMGAMVMAGLALMTNSQQNDNINVGKLLF